MKKLLYIIANSKPENISSSRKVSRKFVDEFLKLNFDYELEEINLYDIELPNLTYKCFENRNTPISNIDHLSEKEKKDIKKITNLCDQFLSADIYVVAAPMWSILFPAPLKQYLDCIILNNKTVKISQDEIKGLLYDKDRSMIYVQSSGGPIPWILNKKLNHGGTYLHDIFKFLGIKDFVELNVDHTGFTEEEKEKAEQKAIDKINGFVERFSDK